MIEQLIAEATECDFKVALETKKPKSWLKSVSAFSNGIGGTLFFGVSDDREPIGLSDVQKDAEAISRLIKERITPLPQFILKPLQEDGKNLLALEVSPGRSTPYYYKADGVMAIIIANVVFPTPGGPHKIKEDTTPESIIFRSTLPGPTRCCCPI